MNRGTSMVTTVMITVRVLTSVLVAKPKYYKQLGLEGVAISQLWALCMDYDLCLKPESLGWVGLGWEGMVSCGIW